MSDQEPLFNSANAALVFALNYSAQQYDRPMMNRMAAPAVGSGKGLIGLDGAAQAGMIRQELAACGHLVENVLISRVAPNWQPCDCRSACCSGKRPNKDWTNAIAYLADQARYLALAGCVCNGMLRREYVVRFFTPKEKRISLDELADRNGIHRNTASAHNAKVAKWLKTGEDQSWLMFDAKLSTSGLINS